MRILVALLVIALSSCGKNDTAAVDDKRTDPAPPSAELTTQTVEILTHVYDTPQAAEPLPVGAQVPAVTVNRVNGEETNLAAEVSDGALLVFYRGGW